MWIYTHVTQSPDAADCLSLIHSYLPCEILIYKHLRLLHYGADSYAVKVTSGYRPGRPDRMDPELFDLIEWCWWVTGLYIDGNNNKQEL